MEIFKSVNGVNVARNMNVQQQKKQDISFSGKEIDCSADLALANMGKAQLGMVAVCCQL